MILLPLALLALGAAPEENLEPLVKRLTGVWAIAEQNAAEPVAAERAFYEGAIPGMLRRLDPHSTFFDPGQFEQLRQLERSTTKGFGSVVSVIPGRVIILQTLPDTPSARSGLAPGDEILSVNGIRLAGLNQEDLMGLLGQSRQQQAQLEVRKPGNARILQFVLTPQQMQSPSVERAFLLRPGIAYLRVASFDSETGKQVREAVEKLGGAALKGLVLDLRNNPGGLMPPALETAALFLKPGQKVVSVRGRKAEEAEVKVPDSAAPYTFPVAVLMNSRSASASEIVAGALQDHDRAAIIGEPSFGKGLVQSVYPLSHGTAMALTTAFYYTPSGRSIQRPLLGGQLDAATSPAVEDLHEYRTDSGRKVHGGGGIQPDQAVQPETTTRLRAVLDASGSFTSFATDCVRKNPAIGERFNVTPGVVDDFQVFLSQRNIRPAMNEWLSELEWVRNRLKTEIFNQALGVEKGDEVEAQRDPQILAALKAIGAL
ncbi:MAG: S41 family peptidase [Acidobacteria bacterium]|nr:S41 family peptidase [Acidobacteriota bacterium]